MQCEHVKKSGTRCNSQALQQSNFCFFHSQDTEVAEKRQQAQQRGGKQPKIKPTLPPLNFDFSDPSNVTRLLEQLAELVYKGQLDRPRAVTIGHLADKALGASALAKSAEEMAQVWRVIKAEKDLPPDVRADVEAARRAAEDHSFRSEVIQMSRAIQSELNAKPGSRPPDTELDRIVNACEEALKNMPEAAADENPPAGKIPGDAQ